MMVHEASVSQPVVPQPSAILPSNVEAWQRPEVPPWRRPMSTGLLGTLVGLTFGLYAFYWLFSTWKQLKQEQDDPAKHPFWHTLAMLVPIYGLFRFHAHMRAIRDLTRAAGASTNLSPGLALVLWVVLNVVERLGGHGDLGNWVIVASACGEALVFAWAQAALNSAWRALPGGALPARIHPLQWVVLVIGGLLSALALVV
jgi:hypothetical protein